MRARSLDPTATRSSALARRAGVVGLAAALIAAPVFAAAPAHADASVVVSAEFSSAEVTTEGVAQGVFYDSVDQFTIPGFDACMFEYKNGVPSASNAVAPVATATAPYARGELLVAAGFVVGDEYTIAYAEPEAISGTCVAPSLSTPNLVQASITLVAAPPARPEIAVTAAPLALQQGVAFDQVVSITAASPFDFSSGGYVDAGPRNSSGYENGELYPYEGIKFEYMQAAPGVTPTLRVHGTPVYAGTVSVGFEIGNETAVGFGTLTLNVANK